LKSKRKREQWRNPKKTKKENSASISLQPLLLFYWLIIELYYSWLQSILNQMLVTAKGLMEGFNGAFACQEADEMMMVEDNGE